MSWEPHHVSALCAAMVEGARIRAKMIEVRAIARPGEPEGKMVGFKADAVSVVTQGVAMWMGDKAVGAKVATLPQEKEVTAIAFLSGQIVMTDESYESVMSKLREAGA